jgi:hypothetical protein
MNQSFLGAVLVSLVLSSGAAYAQEDKDTVLEARLAECAQQQDGECFLRLAAFEEAASAFEKASRTVTEESDFVGESNLLAAIRLRRELGQPDRAYADALEFMRRFDWPLDLTEVAGQVFLLGEILESAGETSKADDFYRAYLRKFGKQGGWDRFLVAHAKLGARRIQQSCPIAEYLGACVVFRQERRLCPDDMDAWGNTPSLRRANRFQEFWRETVTRHKRNPRLVREAKEHLRLVVDAGAAFLAEQDAKASPERRRAWGNAYAEATSLLVAEDLDAFLALGSVPEGLAFEPPTQFDSRCEAERKRAVFEDSQQRFAHWLSAKTLGLAKLWATYREAILRGGPEATVVAAGRFAMVTSRLEEAMWSDSSEICQPHPHHAQRASFMLFENAAVASQSCHELATTFGIDSDLATYCRFETERRWDMRFGRTAKHRWNGKDRVEKPLDVIHEISTSEIFMSSVREDADLAPVEIPRIDTPPKDWSKPHKKPCNEKNAKPARPLRVLDSRERRDFAPVFGRVVPMPSGFAADLAKRFPLFPTPVETR